MINKLLDEPYWDNLESELTAYIRDDLKGFNADLKDTKKVLLSFILCKVIQPIELEYFDVSNGLDPYLKYRAETVPEELVIKEIKENLKDALDFARNELWDYFMSDYLKASNLHPDILLLEKPWSRDPYILVDIPWEIDPFIDRETKDMKSENDVAKLITQVKSLTEHKIKNSEFYKRIYS